jgi:hypothetical protein
MNKYAKNRSIATRTFLGTAWAVMSACTLLVGGAITPAAVQANDIVTHPSNCRATFLNQAFPMRWHEHFLMNPASNQPTYVICPMTFDPDVVTFNNGGTFTVYVSGGIMSGASTDLPTCNFYAHSRFNLRQGIYIDRPPQATYGEGLAVTTSGAFWSAQTNVTRTDVATALDTGSQYNWAVSAVCLLPPGYSLSYIGLFD